MFSAVIAAPVPIVWQFCSSFTVGTVISTPGIFLYGLNVATCGGSGEQLLDLKFLPWFIPDLSQCGFHLQTVCSCSLCLICGNSCKGSQEKNESRLKSQNVDDFSESWGHLAPAGLSLKALIFPSHSDKSSVLEKWMLRVPVAVILLGKMAGIWGKPNVTWTH